MPFEFGDVVLVPFPFTSQANSKKRPAVVVSSGMISKGAPNLFRRAGVLSTLIFNALVNLGQGYTKFLMPSVRKGPRYLLAIAV